MAPSIKNDRATENTQRFRLANDASFLASTIAFVSRSKKSRYAWAKLPSGTSSAHAAAAR